MSIVESKIQEIEKSRNKLRKYLIKEIGKIKPNPNIKRNSDISFTISFSELSKNNWVLSPEYYNFDSQKKIIIDKISKNADCGVAYLTRIVEDGKDKNNVFHPDFLSQISTILNK